MIDVKKAKNALEDLMGSLVGTECNYIGNHFNADTISFALKELEQLQANIKSVEAVMIKDFPNFLPIMKLLKTGIKEVE